MHENIENILDYLQFVLEPSMKSKNKNLKSKNQGMTKRQKIILFFLGVLNLLVIFFGIGIFLYFSQNPIHTNLPNTPLAVATLVPANTIVITKAPTITATATATARPPLALRETVLTLEELNSVTNFNIWEQGNVPDEYLSSFIDVEAIADKSKEYIVVRWNGSVTGLFDTDSTIQIFIQKWDNQNDAKKSIAQYDTDQNIIYEYMKNLPGVFLSSSNTQELKNGRFRVDLLGVDQFSPMVYTAMIHHSNISFIIQTVFLRTEINYMDIMKVYIDMQLKKIIGSGY